MKAGQTIRNRRTGETLTMLVSEEDNGGARQLYRVYLPTHRPSPRLHYHLAFAEKFTLSREHWILIWGANGAMLG
jgi:hypothetical protein